MASDSDVESASHRLRLMMCHLRDASMGSRIPSARAVRLSRALRDIEVRPSSSAEDYLLKKRAVLRWTCPIRIQSRTSFRAAWCVKAPIARARLTFCSMQYAADFLPNLRVDVSLAKRK